MKRKIIIGIALLILVLGALPAFAGITNQQKEDINNLYSQIAEIRKEIVQKYVDAGELTREQGDKIIESIDTSEKNRQENGGGGIPFVGGCGGAGYGMMGESGLTGTSYNNLAIQQL